MHLPSALLRAADPNMFSQVVEDMVRFMNVSEVAYLLNRRLFLTAREKAVVLQAYLNVSLEVAPERDPVETLTEEMRDQEYGDFMFVLIFGGTNIRNDGTLLLGTIQTADNAATVEAASRCMYYSVITASLRDRSLAREIRELRESLPAHERQATNSSAGSPISIPETPLPVEFQDYAYLFR